MIENAECFTCEEGAERLCASVDEAVQEWADQRDPGPLPETVTVYGFARMELPSAERLAERALDDLLERMDEDFADPEGDATKPTPAMQDAALAFAEVFRREYQVWMCRPVGRENVKVAEYVSED